MTDTAAESLVNIEHWKPPDPRGALLVSSWTKRQLPPRDYLLGNTICSTSRWLIFGETGIGKTLFALAMAAAIAAGEPFLNWSGRRPARVIYLDGELPAETFKDRMELIAKTYGDSIPLYGYNREVLGADEMPPLNTEAGQIWLQGEIERVKPDAIFFDAIMCLLSGSMSEEESWAPMKALVRLLSAKHIAQAWLHHTGHNANQSFGTKTREWEMDTIVSLSRADDDPASASVRLEFRKARLRTPETADQFAPRVIRYGEAGWEIEGLAARTKAGKPTDVDIVRQALLTAYDRLADGVAAEPGFDGALVRKVKVEAVRDEVKSRGFLETTDNGAIEAASRKNWGRAKSKLLSEQKFAEQDGLIWRL